MSSKNENQMKGTMYQHLAGKCLPSFRKSMLIYGGEREREREKKNRCSYNTRPFQVYSQLSRKLRKCCLNV
jgi:hypothetical protein